MYHIHRYISHVFYSKNYQLYAYKLYFMTSFFNSITDLNYYFNARPSSGYFDLLLVLIIIFGIMFVVAIYFKFFYQSTYRKEKHYIELGEKISGSLFTTSIFGFLYLFFRYEGIMYLSARVLLYGIFLYFVVTSYYIYRYYTTKFVQLKKDFHTNKNKKVYMPRRRKK